MLVTNIIRKAEYDGVQLVLFVLWEPPELDEPEKGSIEEESSSKCPHCEQYYCQCGRVYARQM
jgi:hypothetical protein